MAMDSKLSSLFFFLILFTPQILACETCTPTKPKHSKGGKGKGPGVLPPVPGVIPKLPLPPVPGVVPKIPTLPPVPGVVPKIPGIVPKLPLPPVPGVVPKIPTLPPVPGIIPKLPLPPVPGVVPKIPTLPPVPGIIPKLPLPPVPGVVPKLPLPPVPGVTPLLPPVTGTPSTPSGPGCPPTDTPPKPPSSETCPLDTLKLGGCVGFLGATGLIHLGVPEDNECCPVISGLVDLEAALCLCTAIKLSALGINLGLPIALQILLTCGKMPPAGFTCPS